ncbi:MAG: hypothetical protein HOQ00_11580, partial [Agromyces sp.]|nr:hypothetical protein [Agromyces sp.]
MPKNKKPAGGRPAKNFDPSYAKGGRKGGPAARNGSASSTRKPGSRSPGHRGYRPEEETPRKERWSREERVATGRTPH